MYTLVIGNKTYSSWSLRPWLVMSFFKIPFEEIIIPLDLPDTKENIQKYSKAGQVPVLVDNGGDDRIIVWESLAIIDYMADIYPEIAIWPKDKDKRAHARSMAAEMHGGFLPIRKACPMNLSKKFQQKDRGEDVAKDVARITQLINEARSKFGDNGEFLYGEFSATDAMYAPVVTRLNTYSIAVDDVTRKYMDVIQAMPEFNQWRDAAMDEPWVLGEDEINEKAIEVYK